MPDVADGFRPTRRQNLWAVIAIVVTGFALLGPFLDRPWTANEANAATYYAPSNANFERFGFWHMWGIWTGTIAHELKWAVGYLNHPPGMAWLTYLVGMEEWQIRLPTVFSVILLGLMVYRWLLARVGVLTAAAAGVLVQVPPTMAVHGQISYELPTAVFGWGMILAFDRALERGRFQFASAFWACFCAFVGTWFDWSFLYVYCPALTLLMWRRVGFWHGVRLLAVPAASATISLALLLWWRVAVETAEHLPAVPPNQSGIWEIYAKTLAEFERHGWGPTLAGTWRVVRDGFTPVLLLIAACGVVPFVRRMPRIFATLSLAILHPALFPSHAIDHPMFWVYAGPLVAISAAMAAHWIRRRLPSALGFATQCVVLAIAFSVPCFSSWSHLSNTTYSFYEDLGRLLTEAVEHENFAEDDTDPLGYNVGHSWPYGAYHAYLRSLRAFGHPIVDVNVLASTPASSAPRGVRFLWFKFGRRPDFTRGDPRFDPGPEFDQYLSQFPRRRVPELEVEIDVTGRGDVVEITEAWMVTLRRPDR